MTRRCATATAALLVAACASHPTIEQLDGRVYHWDHERGLCGEQWALDGDGVLWTEHGCENGTPRFTRVREVTPAERARIEAAFARLPARSPEEPSCNQRDVFAVRTRGGERAWSVCSLREDDPSSLPPPFDEAARALSAPE